MRERSSTIVTSKYGTSTRIHKIETNMKQIRAKGGGGVRERSFTIVTSKYGTSTGIHKIDRYEAMYGGLGDGGGGMREQSSTIVTSKYGTSTGIQKLTDMKQCRVKWGRGGDERAKFYHCYIKIREFNRNS